MSSAGEGGLSRHWAVRLGAVLLFNIVLAEVLLRVLFALGARSGLRPNCGVRPELLGRLVEVYSRGRPSPFASDHEPIVPDPQRGYRLAAGLRKQEMEGAFVSTNSRGHRGTREYALPKSTSVIRIVALGDSMTFGNGVADEESWPAQLEDALPDTEVVNIAAPGYAHDQMYFALRDEGMALGPDAVILGFFANDVWRDELTFYCAEKPRFSRGPEGWHVENVPVPLPWDVYDRYRRLPLLYAVPRVLVEAYRQPAFTERSGQERATEILGRMRQLAETGGARFLIVNLPEHPDAPPHTTGFFYEYCARTGTECIDAWPQFRAAAGTDDAAELQARYLRPHDIHYSHEGYAIVAETVRRYITEHPIVPARPSMAAFAE